MTADRYHTTTGPRDPGSWNRYAYVQGDPINANDPRGMFCAMTTVGTTAATQAVVPAVIPASDGFSGRLESGDFQRDSVVPVCGSGLDR